MHRRELLKDGGLALLALGLTGCATRAAPARPGAATRPPLRLAPVRVGWDRIIRATVGLRPHRPSPASCCAPRSSTPRRSCTTTVTADRACRCRGARGRWPRSWRCEQPDRRAAVLGCGVVGLTTARQLQRRGFDVTIYAATVPPDTTSNMSLAGFTPTSGLVANDRRTPEWDEQFRQAVDIAYRQLQLLAGPKYGISWIYNYAPTDELPNAAARQSESAPAGLGPHREASCSSRAQHPFPTTYAIERPSRCASSRRSTSTRWSQDVARQRRADQDPQVRDAARSDGARRDR